MHPLLHDLHKKQLVWSAGQHHTNKAKISSGFTQVDEALQGGFPESGLIHIKSALGLGELRLVLPAVINKSKQQLCVFISPPFQLNTEFLLAQGLCLEQVLLIDGIASEDALWSAEQCAKSGACAGIFMWQQQLQHTQAKKLELAALKGNCLSFIFSQQQNNTATLPISLSLSLKRQKSRLLIDVNKQKVGWPMPTFSVKVPFKSRLGSPMQRARLSGNHAANVYALHAKR